MSHDHDPENIDYRSTLSLTRVHNALARENPDRVAESRPVSLWISLGAIAVAAIGAANFGANRGFGTGGLVNYNKFGASYKPVEPPPVVPETDGGTVDPFKLGEKVYKKTCISCHMPNGVGQPGQYPPLDGSEWVLGGTERMAAIVGYGLTGPVTVKGQTYSAAIMTPHGPPVLSAAEFAGVLTYVRGSWSNKAEPVSVEGVVDFFARHAGRTALYTEAELKQIPEDKMLLAPAAAAPADAAAPPAGSPPPPAPAPAGSTPPAPPPPQ
jgi:mono/diheme cytochrome c family protein